MSLQPLLEEKTLDEAWSHLYCNALTTRNLTADFVTGGMFSTTNVLTAANFAILAPSTWTIDGASPVQSTQDQWTSLQTGVKIRRLTFALKLSAIVMPTLSNGNTASSATFTLTLPFGEVMRYPSVDGIQLPCSVVVGGVDAANQVFGSCQGVRTTGTVITFAMGVYGNLSTASIGRSIIIQGTISYEVN